MPRKEHNDKRLVSYIFPIYNESENIPILYDTLVTLLSKHPQYNYELVFINDGSRDTSLELLRALQRKDDRIVLINFSRNYGHQMAVTAGIDYAQGDALIIMDSDMQDPPGVSIELLKKWEQGYDVVYAQRRSRKDTLFKKTTADIFYRTLQKLASIDIPRNTGDFRLIDRRVADVIKQFREHDRFLRGMVSYVGFNQTAVPFDRHERYAGVTGYPLKKMVKFAADGIFGFSSIPLQLISRIGYLTASISILGIIYALIAKIFFPHLVVEGWTFIVIAIFFIGSVQMIMLGVVGSYISRIYTEVKNRPLYTTESVTGQRKR